MFFSTTTVALYFGSPFLLALSEQMLKVFLFSCVPQCCFVQGTDDELVY